MELENVYLPYTEKRSINILLHISCSNKKKIWNNMRVIQQLETFRVCCPFNKKSVPCKRPKQHIYILYMYPNMELNLKEH